MAGNLDWSHWEERLRLDVPDLDAQHRYLFHLIKTFDADAPVVRRKEVLMELARYAREHFQLEEAAMARSGYDGFARHRKAHDRLLDELIEFADRNLAHSGTMAEFHAFVRSWLFEHILAMDALFAGHVRACANSDA